MLFSFLFLENDLERYGIWIWYEENSEVNW
jgi:hypothetical protein